MDVSHEEGYVSLRRVTRSMTSSLPSQNTIRDDVSNSHDTGTIKVSPRLSKNSTQKQRKVQVKKRVKIEARTTKIKKAQSRHHFPSLTESNFGLIQERLADNLYHLVIQAILWNQTSGYAARPVLDKLLTAYPTPDDLACASLTDLTAMLQPIGLHNIRAKRCIGMAKQWLLLPPAPERVYKRKGYPETRYHGREDEVHMYEIAHLPGVGPYALDSYRIFHRDKMRGLADDWLGNGAVECHGYEPEWKRVLPLDKELKPYIQWLWAKEGYEWNDITGQKKLLRKEDSHIYN